MNWSASVPLLAVALAAAAAWMALLWAVQLRTRNAGIVDFGWALALGGMAVGFAVAADGWIPRRALVGAAGGLWGIRLGTHLLRDRVLGRPEEGRYVALRALWGPRADAAFFWFFQAQALLAVILSLPFLLAASGSRPGWVLWDGAGAILWLTGWIGESVADRQLARWKADPVHRGKTCRTGLWRVSRHPNYFFEWILWCGFGAFALGTPGGWVGLSAPLLLLFFILRVTGIPPTEAQALRTRGEDYRRYQQTTSVFVPWFPRKEPRP